MRDEKKSRAELMEELGQLRRRVAELEGLQAGQTRPEDRRGKIKQPTSAESNAADLGVAEKALRESEEAERRFARQLAALQEVTNGLSQCPSVEDLCRRAVEEGRSRLGFDRLSVWLVEEDPSIVVGTFGVDEEGRLRDERNCRAKPEPGSVMWPALTGRASASYEEVAPLRNDRSEVIGHGSQAIAALWDGEKVIGCVCTDNLLRHEPIDERGRELLVLYATALGHLCTRKRAEEALRDSEALFHSLVESIPMNVFRKDLDGRFTFGNKLFCETLGRPLEEIIGKTDHDFFPKEMAEKYRADDARVAQTGEIFEDVEEHQKPNGEKIYVQVFKTPVRNFKGEVIGTQGMFWGVTEQRLAEEKIERSQRTLQTIMDSMPLGFVVVGKDKRVQRANAAALRTMKYGSEKELLGAICHKTFCLAEEGKCPVLDLGQEVDRSERILLTKRGEKIPILKSVIPVILNDEEVLLEGFVDISELKRVQEALIEEKYLLDTLMDNLPDSIYFKDEQSRFTKLSKALARRFELSCPSEALGKTDFDFFTEEHARPAFEDEQEVMRTGQALVGREEKETWSDGTVTWALTTKMPLRDKEGKIIGTFGVSRDITDRKEAEEELKKTARELARSNTELEQFAYVASHDLQEPLRMVASYAQLLENRYKGKLDCDADDYIAFIVDGATRMRALINDLLAYSRVGTRGKPFEPTDCEAVFGRALTNLEMAVEETNAVVTHNRLPTVMGDELQLSQVFQNLVGNAIKFHGEDRPLVHVSSEQRGVEWVFSVRDNGIGIAPEHKGRIFVIFQRLHSRTEYPGTGIGLAICRKIVERHGGRIWVESQPGEGSTFYFTLPVAEGQTQ